MFAGRPMRGRRKITPQKHVGEITQICLLCTLFAPLARLSPPLGNKLQPIPLVHFFFFLLFFLQDVGSRTAPTYIHLGFTVARGFDLVLRCPSSRYRTCLKTLNNPGQPLWRNDACDKVNASEAWGSRCTGIKAGPG